ncbi:MAG: acyl-CoA thioesterase [Sulfobacillus sp.]
MPTTVKPEEYHHETLVRVRFCETDANQHVSQASYVIYLEEARIAFLESLASRGFDWWNDDHTLVLVQQCVTYKRPAYFRQTLKVYTRPTRLGRSSLDLHHVIVLLDNLDIVIAESTSTVVFLEISSGSSMPWPESFRQTVETLMPAST